MCDITALYQAIFTDVSVGCPGIGSSLPVSPISKSGGAGATEERTVREYAALALARSIGKKCTDIVSDDAAEVCLLSFVEANESCRAWTLPRKIGAPKTVQHGFIRSNPEYEGLRAVWNREMIEQVKTCFNATFNRPTPMSLLREFPDFDGSNPFGWDNIFLCGNVGPGAALSASGTSWYDKFYQSTLTYTSFELMEAYIDSLPVGTLREIAEQQRYAAFGTLRVSGGVYGSVPKSFSTERSIETQPSVNMWAQKGLATIIYAYLNDKYGFDLSWQPSVNGELARRGSIDGSLATIDLKDASNRIPLKLIEWLIDGTPLLARMLTARTEQITMPWGGDLDLHLFASMGNGFTFILQTAVFLAVLEAVYTYRQVEMGRTPRAERNPLLDFLSSPDSQFEDWDDLQRTLLKFVKQDAIKTADLPRWGVFGDDIICPTEFYDDVVATLELINARVNLDKSFSQGSFRESCGFDWFRGHPVRGVYCKSLKTIQDRVVTLNRLIEWTAITGIGLPHACQLLWRSLSGHIFTVPLSESHDAGVRVTSDRHRAKSKSEQVLGSEKDLQCRIQSYISYVPVTVKRTFRNNELAIYGPGLLLSVIRGETRSEFATCGSSSVWKSKGDRTSVLTQMLRGRDGVAYESKWCWTTCWDNTLNPYYNADKMDMALSQNLGASLR